MTFVFFASDINVTPSLLDCVTQARVLYYAVEFYGQSGVNSVLRSQFTPPKLNEKAGSDPEPFGPRGGQHGRNCSDQLDGGEYVRIYPSRRWRSGKDGGLRRRTGRLKYFDRFNFRFRR